MLHAETRGSKQCCALALLGGTVLRILDTFGCDMGHVRVKWKKRLGGYSNLSGNLQFSITAEAIRRYVFLSTLQSGEYKLSSQISH